MIERKEISRICFKDIKPEPIYADRYIYENGSIIHCGVTNNTGIECYILEILCTPEIRREISSLKISKWANILMKDIISKSISYKNRLFWRWEYNSERSDYDYPLDWDDTFKAIDAIKEYAKCFGMEKPSKLPNISLITELLEKTIYHNNMAGQDIKINCKNDESLYMFITDIDIKRNNTEDVMVTAVAIRSLIKNYRKREEKTNRIILRLLNKIIDIIEIGIDEKIPLMKLSRCYLSWGLLLTVIIDINKYIPSIQDKVYYAANKYLKNRLFIELLPKEIFNNLIIDELNYARLVGLGLGVHNEAIDNYYYREVKSKQDDPQFMFRHRRLENYYGSKKWSLLLDEYVKKKILVKPK